MKIILYRTPADSQSTLNHTILCTLGDILIAFWTKHSLILTDIDIILYQTLTDIHSKSHRTLAEIHNSILYTVKLSNLLILLYLYSIYTVDSIAQKAGWYSCHDVQNTVGWLSQHIINYPGWYSYVHAASYSGWYSYVHAASYSGW